MAVSHTYLFVLIKTRLTELARWRYTLVFPAILRGYGVVSSLIWFPSNGASRPHLESVVGVN